MIPFSAIVSVCRSCHFPIDLDENPAARVLHPVGLANFHIFLEHDLCPCVTVEILAWRFVSSWGLSFRSWDIDGIRFPAYLDTSIHRLLLVETLFRTLDIS